MDNFKCAQHLSWRDLGDHIIILDSKENQMVHHLEDVSALIWRSLEKNLDSKEIIDSICLEFEVEHLQAQEDFENFVQDLKKNGLLEE